MAVALMKQYGNLVKNIDSFSDGQAKLTEGYNSDEDSLTEVHVTLTPNSGPYRGGSFIFKIWFSDDFPIEPPDVFCCSEIYHPNIDMYDYDGEVCLNLFDELWSSDMTLEDVVQGLLFLLHNPNIDDPINEDIFSGSEGMEEFEKNVRRSLKGEVVGEVKFKVNLIDGYESESEEDHEDSECEEADSNDSDESNSEEKAHEKEVASIKSLRLKISSVDVEDRPALLISNIKSLSRSVSRLIGRISDFLYGKFTPWSRTRKSIESSVDVVRR